MVFRDFEDETKKENNLMSEHLKEDLQKKIEEILEQKEEKIITEVETSNTEEEVSDREWYKNSLYESLVRKWAK